VRLVFGVGGRFGVDGRDVFVAVMFVSMRRLMRSHCSGVVISVARRRSRYVIGSPSVRESAMCCGVRDVRSNNAIFASKYDFIVSCRLRRRWFAATSGETSQEPKRVMSLCRQSAQVIVESSGAMLRA